MLAKKISSDKKIIDVGANFGDTAIAMLNNCRNPIICIEASDQVFPYLTKNIEQTKTLEFGKVRAIKHFVGTGFVRGELEHSYAGGTARLRRTKSSTVKPVELDHLVESTSNIILLKVDTDGLDYDVIKSSRQILLDSNPILYWENQMSDDVQFEGYDQLYVFLTKLGYDHIYVFDNFGNLILEKTDFDTLRNINSYVLSMDKHGCTRTFYYTDVLTSTKKHLPIVEAAIYEYRSEWIEKGDFCF